MLGIANKHGELGEIEPGTDPSIFAGQPGNTVPDDVPPRYL
jgi:hypothetical protein